MLFDTVWYCLMLFDAVWWTLKQRYAPLITEFNGFQWNGLEFNGIQWNGMRTGIQWCVLEFNGMEWPLHDLCITFARTGMSVGIRWSVWWEVLGQCAGKRRAENRDTCCDIETFISEETFAFLHFLHFLHLDGCHKASLFLLKFHALFTGSLDSFSTSGRTGGAQGNAKVMQRSCKGRARGNHRSVSL